MPLHKGIIDAVTDAGDAIADFGTSVDKNITQPLLGDVGDKLNQFGDFVAPFVENYTIYGVAASWLRDRITPDSKAPPATLNVRGSTQAPIPLIYGEVKTGGQFVTLQVRDSSKILGGAFVISSGEIDSITNIIIDDKPINHADYDGGSIFDYTIHTGLLAPTADTNLQLFPDYTSAFTFNEIAYISSINTFRRDGGPKGIPKIEVTVRGRKVYDPRSTLTVWSDNPALCALDFLTNTTYGYGFPLSDINLTSVSASADLCDTLIPATARKLFVLNGSFLPATEDKDRTLDKILNAFRSSIKLDGSGDIEFASDIDRLPLFTLNESNVIKHTISGAPGTEVFNGAEVSWVDINGDRDIAYYSNATFLAEDGAVEKMVDIQLKTDNNYDRAMDLGEFVVRQSRQGLSITAVCDFSVFELTIHDVVNVTLSEYGFTNKLFRVIELSLSEDLIVEVVIVEHDPTAYLYSVHSPNYVAPAISLPDERDITVVQTLALSSQTYFAQNYESIGQIAVSWSAPSLGLVDTYEVEFKSSASGVWVASGVTAATDWIVNNVTADNTWDVRVRAINISRYSSEWVEILGFTFVPAADNGLTLPPVTGLSLQGGGTSYTGRSPTFFWASANWDGVNVNPGTGVAGDSSAAMYLVEVFNSLNQQIYGETITASSYEFTDEKNSQGVLTESGGATAQITRELEVRVRAKDKFGRLSTPAAILTVTNPPPNIAQIVWSVTAGFRRATIQITTHPIDNDYLFSSIHISTTNGFTADATNKVGEVSKESATGKFYIDYLPNGSQLEVGTTYYVRLSPTDAFGVDFTNITSQISVAPVISGVLADELNAFSSIALGASSAWQSRGFQVDIDPYNNTGVPGFFCGDLDDEKYIEFSEPTLGQPELRLGRETKFRGADAYNNEAVYDNWLLNESLLSFDVVGLGSVSTTFGVLSQLNGSLVGDYHSTFREISKTVVTTTWTKGRRFKTAIRFKTWALGSQSEHHVVTGHITNPVGNIGTYFGFKIFNIGDLRATYNTGGGGQIFSANLATLNTFDTYKFEAISDVDNGEITYYLDDALIHTFAVNTNAWVDVLSGTFWMINQYHQSSTGLMELNYGAVKFLQEE